MIHGALLRVFYIILLIVGAPFVLFFKRIYFSAAPARAPASPR